jgi:hypothetical protein
MRRIPPVDEFFMEYLGVDCDFMESMREQLDECSGFDFGTISDTMIEFAKRHAEDALKEASEQAYIVCGRKTKKDCKQCMGGGCEKPIIDEDSILKAYPPENIK